MTLTVDPEFRDLIPRLSAEERAGLESNIQQYGCHTAIAEWKGIIVDGHNRYAICRKHNIPFDTRPMQFADRCEAIIWIIRNQFDRRNLSVTDRMDLALRMKSEIQAQAQLRQKAGVKADLSLNLGQGKTQKQLASLAGVSHGTLDKYEAITKAGTPELISAVKTGQVSVHAASQAVKHLKPEVQIEVLKSAPGKIGKIVQEEIARHETKKKSDNTFREMVKQADGLSGKPKQDPVKYEAQLLQQHRLYDAIEHLSSMPPAKQVLESIPSYQLKQLERIDLAINWLTEFSNAYKEK